MHTHIHCFIQSQLSCSTLPSQLTPERPGELTQVSLDDSSCLDTPDDSVELERAAKTCNRWFSLNSTSTSPMVRRLSLALPSPQNSDVDEAVRNSADDASSSPDSVQQSQSLVSPRDSDVDEPVCSDSHSSSQETSGASLTGIELVSWTVCDWQVLSWFHGMCVIDRCWVGFMECVWLTGVELVSWTVCDWQVLSWFHGLCVIDRLVIEF
jgi:hypothetical protein